MPQPAEGERKETCGKTTITMPERAAYYCHCDYKSLPPACTWVVVSRGTVFEGTGRESEPPPPGPPPHSHFKISGPIAECAKGLERTWKRRVIVPRELKGTTVKRRTFKGDLTPERIAEGLGLNLGPKLGR